MRESLNYGSKIINSNNNYTYVIDDSPVSSGSTCLVYKGKRLVYLNGCEETRKVIIKEYYPLLSSYCLKRNDNNSLIVPDFIEHSAEYSIKKERFENSYKKYNELTDDDTINNHIIHSVDKFSYNNTIYIVMDYNNGINFNEYINYSKDICDFFTKLKQLVYIVKMIHNKGYVHFDLKPENCWVDFYGIKLLDVDSVININDIGNSDYDLSYSDGFSAPEIYELFTYPQKNRALGRLKRRAFKADIYSIGAIVFYYIFQDRVRHFYFKDNISDKINNESVKNGLNRRGIVYSEENIALLVDFLKKTICSETSERIGADELIQKIDNLLFSFSKDDSMILSEFSSKKNPGEFDYILKNYISVLNGYDLLKDKINRWDLPSIYFIVGPSGSGKSFLLKKICVDFECCETIHNIKTFYCYSQEDAEVIVRYSELYRKNNEKYLIMLDLNLTDDYFSKIADNIIKIDDPSIRIIITLSDSESRCYHEHTTLLYLNKYDVERYLIEKGIKISNDNKVLDFLVTPFLIEMFIQNQRDNLFDIIYSYIEKSWDGKAKDVDIFEFLAKNGDEYDLSDIVVLDVAVKKGILVENNGVYTYSNAFIKTFFEAYKFEKCLKLYDYNQELNLFDYSYNDIELFIYANVLDKYSFDWNRYIKSYFSNKKLNNKQNILTFLAMFYYSNSSIRLEMNYVDLTYLSGIVDILQIMYENNKRITFNSCRFDKSFMERKEDWIIGNEDEEPNILEVEESGSIVSKISSYFRTSKHTFLDVLDEVDEGFRISPVLAKKYCALGKNIYTIKNKVIGTLREKVTSLPIKSIELKDKIWLIKYKTRYMLIDSKSKNLLCSIYDDGMNKGIIPIKIKNVGNYVAVGWIKERDVKFYNETSDSIVKKESLHFEFIKVIKICKESNKYENILEIKGIFKSYDLISIDDKIVLAYISFNKLYTVELPSKEICKIPIKEPNLIGDYVVGLSNRFIVLDGWEKKIYIYNPIKSDVTIKELPDYFYPSSATVCGNHLYLKEMALHNSLFAITLKENSEGNLMYKLVRKDGRLCYDFDGKQYIRNTDFGSIIKHFEFNNSFMISHRNDVDILDTITGDIIKNHGIDIEFTTYTSEGVIINDTLQLAIYCLLINDISNALHILKKVKTRNKISVINEHSNEKQSLAKKTDYTNLGRNMFLDYVCRENILTIAEFSLEWICLSILAILKSYDYKLTSVSPGYLYFIALSNYPEKKEKTIYVLAELLLLIGKSNKKENIKLFERGKELLKYTKDMKLEQGIKTYNEHYKYGSETDIFLFYKI